MESLEELKAIIDNAPEGASHVDDTYTYWKVVSEFDYYFYNGSQWDDSESIQSGTRSLSDIARIIELMGIVEDAAALGFLTPSFDSGVSHKQLCKKYEALK